MGGKRQGPGFCLDLPEGGVRSCGPGPAKISGTDAVGVGGNAGRSNIKLGLTKSGIKNKGSLCAKKQKQTSTGGSQDLLDLSGKTVWQCSLMKDTLFPGWDMGEPKGGIREA